MPRSLVIGCLVSVLSALTGAGCANHAQRAVALYDAGDYAGAARAAEGELAAHPGEDSLWQMRIRAALALGDGDGVARTYAAYRARTGDDDRELLRELAIATLGQALTQPSIQIKIAAIEAVEAAELLPLAEQVAQRMGDDDDRVIAAAAVAVLHGFPQAPQAAGDMLHSEDAEARRIAVDGIGKKVGKLAFGDLEAAAGDSDPRVRRTALRWLGQLKDPGAVDIAIQRARDPDEAVRAAAITALARLAGAAPPAAVAPIAAAAVTDRALSVRLAGIELFAALRDRPRLAALAADPDPLVATEAAIAAGGGPPAARALDRAATAADWAIRAGAANLAVRAVGRPGALALAHRLASDPELAVRLAAGRVLAHTGEPAAAIAIFAAALAASGPTSGPAPAAATDPPADNDLRLEAAIDLAAEGDPRGAQALDAAVRDRARSPAVRAAAASGHLPARTITAGLVAALADGTPAVRVAAAAALAMLTKHDKPEEP